MKYKVSVLRTSYSHLDIIVEARNAAHACAEAVTKASDIPFPADHCSNYKAQGASETMEDLS
jgi:hypothetical protein